MLYETNHLSLQQLILVYKYLTCLLPSTVSINFSDNYTHKRKYKYFKVQPEYAADKHRLYVQHLKNRDGLRPMIVEFVRRTRQLMNSDKAAFAKEGTTSQWISTGLLKLSHHMLYQPSTLALIGDIDPSSLESDFRLFDSKFHYYIIPFPRWISSLFLSRELAARSRLNNSWLKNRDPPGASQFHQDRLALLSNNSQ